MNSTTNTDSELYQQLNQETGKLNWHELQRHFARGVVVKVDPALDLVDVAKTFVRDDKKTVEHWLNTGQIAKAEENDAVGWQAVNANFWAIVAAPWVLVQEYKEN